MSQHHRSQDSDRRVSELMEALLIPGVSTQEGAISAHVEEKLRALGVPAVAIARDRAQEQSEYGGETGNLIVRLPRCGGHQGAARLFMTHLDTVELCRGARPRVAPAAEGRPARIVNDNPAAALGADCRSGVTILLNLARFLMAPGRAHPPVTFVFTVQEELGLIGARGLDLTALQPDPPVMGFNFDGHAPREILTAVTGVTRFFMELHGQAAHAGSNPQDGVSTAVAASLALAELARDGWHGAIERSEGRGSANIGVMQGGKMTNTVMDAMSVRGEARSHDRLFRQRIVDTYRETYERAAAATRNAAGRRARMEWSLGPCYEAFALAPETPVVRAAAEAIRALGLEPVCLTGNGGCDANWINAKGLPMADLGTGQHGAHTVAEWIDLEEFQLSCRLAELIAVA